VPIPANTLLAALAAFVLGGGPIVLQGDHGYAPTVGRYPDGAVIDARGATWRLNNSRNAAPTPGRTCKVGNLPTNPYPLRINGARGGMLLGGHIIGEVPFGSAHTDTYCNSAGVIVQSPDFTVRGLRVDQAWDGIRSRPPEGSAVRLEGVWVNGARDDCIENDRLATLDISDSLLDHCFSGLSLDRGACKSGCRPPPGSPHYRLDRVLLRVSPYPLRTSSGGVEHHGGPFLKTSDPTPAAIEITNSVFAFEDIAPRMYSRMRKGWERVRHCSNNRLLYLGGNALPEGFPEPPPCFAVITGAEAQRQWERERSAWLARPH
jgi:hypothetical protein